MSRTLNVNRQCWLQRCSDLFRNIQWWKITQGRWWPGISLHVFGTSNWQWQKRHWCERTARAGQTRSTLNLYATHLHISLSPSQFESRQLHAHCIFSPLSSQPLFLDCFELSTEYCEKHCKDNAQCCWENTQNQNKCRACILHLSDFVRSKYFVCATFAEFSNLIACMPLYRPINSSRTACPCKCVAHTGGGTAQQSWRKLSSIFLFGLLRMTWNHLFSFFFRKNVHLENSFSMHATQLSSIQNASTYFICIRPCMTAQKCCAQCISFPHLGWTGWKVILLKLFWRNSELCAKINSFCWLCSHQGCN